MKGEECKFTKIMSGGGKRLVIPVYQRNYDWKIEHCKQLYTDLKKIILQKRKSHFFGSIVSQSNPDGAGSDDEYRIIDGQQRLTTVSLLFLAIYNLLDKGKLIAKDKLLKEKIFDYYLIDQYKSGDDRFRLRPVKHDRTAYEKLFGDPTEFVPGSNITTNYCYFCEELEKKEVSVDDIYNALCRLEIISIHLNSDDNAQLIFESLNSTGLGLSEGDKIRNFILMGQSTEEQEVYYEKYWNKIEQKTQFNVSAFVRDYLSVKEQSIPSQNKVYTVFKEYVEREKIQSEPLLCELLDYAKRYAILLDAETPSKALNGCIRRLNRLETTVSRPFFLEVLRLYDEGKLDLNQVTQIFLTAESYIARRFFSDLPTSSLNKVFLTLHHRIVSYEKNEENYVEKYKCAITTRTDNARFPDDREFIEKFINKPVYKMHAKNRIYILERLENGTSLEDKDIYRHCDEGSYSTEHIMPQELNSAWKKELGPDYERIHEEWLHRIGNLTLTAYNSKYKNASFTQKKTMEHGFNDSGIKLNAWIAKQDKWTLEEIQKRSQILADKALTIWPMPVTTYKPTGKQMSEYSLDEQADLTGRKIVAFRYKDTQYPVRKWVEMFSGILSLICDAERNGMTELATSQDKGLASNFTISDNLWKSREYIGHGIYVWTNNSTESKLSILTGIFKRFNLDPNDLVFIIRDDEAPEQESADGMLL